MMPSTIRIEPPLFDAVSAVGIGGCAAIVAVAFVWILSRRNSGRATRLGVAAALVMGLSGAAASGGLLARFDLVPPPMLVMIVGVLAMGIGLGSSVVGRDAALELPMATLVGLQTFRLPLELLMHRAGSVGIMPPQLSYGGYNFDIVTGAGACALYTLMKVGVRVPRAVLWMWNLWGIWCLAVIFAVAVTTSPVVRLFGDDPRNLNTWVLFFPYVWLPVVLVTAAIAGHAIVTRALLRRG
jgi:hypothetical protein